jgi:GTP cyclohydrolase II
LLTNNPSKISCLAELGIKVSERVPLDPTVNAENAYYLFTKAQRMNHLLNLAPLSFNGSQGSEGFGK